VRKRLVAILLLITLTTTAAALEVSTRYLGGLEELDWFVIEGDELAAAGARELTDVLEGVPGVLIQRTGVAGGLATVSLRGAPSRQVRVLLDGVPLNSAVNGTVDLNAVPLRVVERIEISRGAAGNLAGGAAVGGVINIVTNSDRTSFSAAVGENGEQHFGFSERTGEPSLIVDAWLEEYAGRRPNSDCERPGGRAGLEYEGGGLLLRGLVGMRGLDQGVPGPRPAADDIPAFGDDEVGSLRDRQEERETYIGFHAGLELERLELSLDFRWSELELDYLQWYEFDGIYRDQSRYLTTTYYGSLGASWRATDWLSVSGALDYRTDDLAAELESTRWSEPFDPGDAGSTTVTTWRPAVDNLGGRLRVRADWSPVALEAALRLDRHADFGLHWSPGAVLRYTGDWFEAALAGGLSFAAPTLNDLYWPDAGNPELEPETARQLDLTVDLPELGGLLGGGAALTLGGFYRETTDLIAWQPDTDGRWRPVNVNEQVVLGATAGVQWSSLRLFYTYTDAVQRHSELVYSDWESGDVFELVERRAAFVPRHQLQARLTVCSFVELELNWTAERRAYYPDYSEYPVVGMHTKRLPAAYDVNVLLDYAFGEHLTVIGALENLTDSDVPAAFGNDYADRNYPRRPRRFVLGVELNF
jgi:outer membrane receptor protein involved in Fe transport